MVVSASANNEGFTRSGAYPIYEFGMEKPQYTDEQFECVLERAVLEDSDKRLRIAEVTNRIPYHVSEVIKIGNIALFEEQFA